MAHSVTLSDQVLPISDAELIAAILSGSEDGFEDLVRRYQRPVVGYVYRILNDHDSALDVAQEVFIKVYNSLDRYNPEYRFSTWLYRIAHNAAIDHLRRKPANSLSLETQTEDGPYQLQIKADEPSPEEERELVEWRNGVGAIIRELPAAYRELILLRHGRDLSYDEIAEVTGLPLGTVKNRLFRARNLMRTAMLERGLDSI